MARGIAPKLEKVVYCCVDDEEGTGMGDGDIQEVGAHSLKRMLASSRSMEKAPQRPLELIRVYGPKLERLVSSVGNEKYIGVGARNFQGVEAQVGEDVGYSLRRWGRS